jgi:hypothetical protein
MNLNIRYGTVRVRVVEVGRRCNGLYGRGRRWMVLPVFLLACLAPQVSDGQVLDIIDIINAAVKKVVVATDLEVQRLQTGTIDAQNTQKELENAMQQSELTDITGWVQQQRDLFAGFYQELWEVKEALSTAEQVAEMIDKQAQIVAGFKQAWAAVQQDNHFSAAELGHMNAVLSGIMNESVQNITRLGLVIRSLVTSMSDGARLGMVDETGRAIDRNYGDLALFSQQSFLLSVQRARDEREVGTVMALYGVR